jgi:hypothetical protein
LSREADDYAEDRARQHDLGVVVLALRVGGQRGQIAEGQADGKTAHDSDGDRSDSSGEHTHRDTVTSPLIVEPTMIATIIAAVPG